MSETVAIIVVLLSVFAGILQLSAIICTILLCTRFRSYTEKQAQRFSALYKLIQRITTV